MLNDKISEKVETLQELAQGALIGQTQTFNDLCAEGLAHRYGKHYVISAKGLKTAVDLGLIQRPQ